MIPFSVRLAVAGRLPKDLIESRLSLARQLVAAHEVCSALTRKVALDLAARVAGDAKKKTSNSHRLENSSGCIVDVDR